MQVSENSQLTYGINNETIRELLQQNQIKKLSKQDVASRLQQTLSQNKNSYHQSMSPGRVFMINSGSNQSPKNSSVFSHNQFHLQRAGQSINEPSEMTFNKQDSLDNSNPNVTNSMVNKQSALFGSDRNQSLSEESHVAMMG
jgi:hypothetical protein